MTRGLLHRVLATGLRSLAAALAPGTAGRAGARGGIVPAPEPQARAIAGSRP